MDARARCFLHCFFSEIVEGDIVLTEHEAMKWLTEETLDSVDWLAADIKVVEELKRFLAARRG